MIAIISARAGSKRLPGKNKIDFFGKPIIRYIIENILLFDLIDEGIFVKTNDEEIVKMIYEAYNTVGNVKVEYTSIATDDDATLTDSVRYLNKYKYMEYNRCILIYPTAVLMEIDEIKQGINLFNTGKYDVVYPVNKDGSHVGEWFIFNMLRILKGEEILRGVLEEKQGRIVKKYEGVDIHDAEDLQKAKELYIERLRKYL